MKGKNKNFYKIKPRLLFKRLYNWIKYKTLPTSFLFKNRLFIERDSKHRRIFNMFGYIFKSSKWGNYETPNLQPKFKVKFSSFMRRFFVTAFFVLLIIYRRYFNVLDFSGFACLLGWMLFETVDYFCVFIVWLCLFIFYSTLNWIYVYLLEQAFSITLNKPDPAARRFFDSFNQHYKEQINKDIKPTFELNGYFYNWICDPSNPERTLQFAKLFQSKLNKKSWEAQYFFFYKLFRFTYLCKLLDNNFTISKGALWPDKQRLNPLFIVPTFCKNFMFTPTLWSCESNSIDDLIQKYENLKDSYQSFVVLRTHKNNAPYIIKSLFGTFYLNQANFNNVLFFDNHSTGLLQIEHVLKTQINLSKWNRWLYRYSILHRRVLKNSHKLTITKRLFQSGFYDHRLVMHNPWFNHRANKMKKPLSSYMNVLFYSDFFSPALPTHWKKLTEIANLRLSQKAKADNFSKYETSFFWFIKRFYLFNTIETNFMKSTTEQLKQQGLLSTISDTTSMHYSNLIYLSKLPGLSNNDFSFVNLRHTYTPVLKASFLSSYYTKDLVLFFDEPEIFSPEVLNLLYWVISPVSDSYQRPLTFSPLFRSDLSLTSYSPVLKNLTPSSHPLFSLDYDSKLVDSNLAMDVVNWTYFF